MGLHSIRTSPTTTYKAYGPSAPVNGSIARILPPEQTRTHTYTTQGRHTNQYIIVRFHTRIGDHKTRHMAHPRFGGCSPRICRTVREEETV